MAGFERFIKKPFKQLQQQCDCGCFLKRKSTSKEVLLPWAGATSTQSSEWFV